MTPLHETSNEMETITITERITEMVQHLRIHPLVLKDPILLKMEVGEAFVRFAASLISNRVDHVRNDDLTRFYDVPNTWWDAFKDQWFRGNLRMMFPPTMRSITIETWYDQTWHSCPHMAIEGRPAHLEYLHPHSFSQFRIVGPDGSHTPGVHLWLTDDSAHLIEYALASFPGSSQEAITLLTRIRKEISMAHERGETR